MPRAQSNGISIEYEVMGPTDGTPLLLIHGLGAQMVRWPDEFCRRLVDAGFRVIRFDNRDVGLSTHLDGVPVPDGREVIAARQRGEEPDLPYTLSDMARDSLGLLDWLKIERAHVLGVSMGGMIAQTMAIEHPGRILSLAIIMSQSGNPDLPPSDPQALGLLAMPAPDPASDREAYLAHSVKLNMALGSPDYPTPEDELRHFAALAADRAYDPAGAGRQFAASRGAADRRAALQQLSVPTLVIHGADDRLIPLAGGEDIARHVKGAWLLAVNGMGHDLPAPLFGLIVANVALNSSRAGPADEGERT